MYGFTEPAVSLSFYFVSSTTTNQGVFFFQFFSFGISDHCPDSRQANTPVNCQAACFTFTRHPSSDHPSSEDN